MSNACLTQIRLRKFKSFGDDEETIDLRPLTVIVGRNNSGKSTILQSLLLLKQTLLNRRPEVALDLGGEYVQAASLRELTHGRPEHVDQHAPELILEWTSIVRPRLVLETGRRPIDMAKMAQDTGFGWLKFHPEEVRLTTTLGLHYREIDSVVSLQPLTLISRGPSQEDKNHNLELVWDRVNLSYYVRWNNKRISELDVRLDHFLPYIVPTREAKEPARKVARVFRLLYEQPLDDLRELLLNLTYVGAMRAAPAELYRKPTSISTRDVSPDGRRAPELVYENRTAIVHKIEMPSTVRSDKPMQFSDRVRAQPFEAAVAKVLQDLGIDVTISLADLGDVGFRLLFDNGSFPHVGRGIGAVLPVVVAGLISDPLMGEDIGTEISREEYLAKCKHVPLLMLEEVESHLHPKAQTALAHFMLALARCGRQVMIETHSDHLVRRLRGLFARTVPGSETEAWLRDNIRLVHVEQSASHVTSVQNAVFTTKGTIESWPAEFMDEASDEEEVIYRAGIKKTLPKAIDAKEEYLRNVHFNEK